MRLDSIDRRTLVKVMGTSGALGIAGCVSTDSDGGDDGGDGNSGTADRSGPVELSNINVICPDNQTGPYDYLFVSGNKMVDLAWEDIEEAGGPLGADVNWMRRDTATRAPEWMNVVQQGVFNNNAAFVFGSSSAALTAHRDWIVEQEVPVVTGWPGAVSLRTFGGDGGTPQDLSDDGWIWRTIVGDSLTQIGAAQFAYEDQGWEDFGVFHGSSADQQQVAQAFADTLESAGGTVHQTVQVASEKTSYQSELGQMPWDDLDAIWITLTIDDGIPFVREWANSDYGDKPALLQEWARPPEFVEKTKDLLAGKEIYTMAGTPATDDPRYQEAKQRFEEQFPDTDWYPQFTLPGYDAAIVACLALHRAGTLGNLPADPSIEAIRKGIERNLGPVGRSSGTEVTSFEEGKEELDAGNEINYQGTYSDVNFTQYGNVLVPINMLKYPTEDEEDYQQTTTVTIDELTQVVEGNY